MKALDSSMIRPSSESQHKDIFSVENVDFYYGQKRALKSIRTRTFCGTGITPLIWLVSTPGGGSLPGQWLSGMVRPSNSDTPRARASPTSSPLSPIFFSKSSN
jgi:hypothetical protein